MSHTKGPWTPAVHTVTDTMRARMEVGSRHVAICTDHDKSAGEELLVAICGEYPDGVSMADARLIAAAPDLLAALEVLVKNYPVSQLSNYKEPIEKAKAAIAKAKGEG